ncbi:hypothetical protein N9E38_00630 [Yoonia sp.]|nr:hypothetical protein [Yoonia sp.]MDC1399074.1 hypothetical protein [Yoonia sp.]
MNLSQLNAALQDVDSAICRAAAARLEVFAGHYFDLHLRNAGLTPQNVVPIAEALAHFDGPELRSFSISYNPSIGDVGAIALLTKLPKTVTELGMVGCALGDESGKALLDWGRQATKVRMVCVEGNQYSCELRKELLMLGQGGLGPSIFV